MIRVATPDDAVEIRRIYAPAVNQGVTSFETVVPEVAELRERVGATLQHYPWLVDQGDEGLRGFAYATSHRARAAYRWSVEVSVYVDAGRLRQGCGRQLYEQLFTVLISQGFCSAYASIAVPNTVSQAFHDSLGFKRIGVFPRVGFKHGVWRDVGWWYMQLLEDDLATDPPAPIPFASWRSAESSDPS
ncbi:MAG: GNAT family N-acetyltransferase [Pirellulaceae bacterium]|nr:GNAT family N-acetyltransferase [Pirellulaceae bacterium]